MTSRRLLSGRVGGPRRHLPGGGVLLNARWHKAWGSAHSRRCPKCDAEVAAGDHAVHYGGALYHSACALN